MNILMNINMNINFLKALGMAAALLFLSQYALAQTSIWIEPESQMALADQYFETGQYFLAIPEYERFVHFFPQNQGVRRALFQIGKCYLKLKQYPRARDAFDRLVERYESGEYVNKAYFLIAESFTREKKTGPALNHLRNLIALSEDPAIRDEAHYRLGWLYIEKGQWERAKENLARIRDSQQAQYRLNSLFSQLKKADRIPQKSPWLAGLFSVVPGGGFLYCGRYRDALTAFLFNSALMLAAYESFDQDLPALGGVIAFVELGFYAGNIYGGISSAHKYNRSQTRHFIRGLRENSRLSLSVGRERMALSFSWRF